MQGCTAIFNDLKVIENVRKAKTTFFAFRPLISPGWTYQSLLRFDLLRAAHHVIHGRLDLIIAQRGVAAFGWHGHWGCTLKAGNGMGV